MLFSLGKDDLTAKVSAKYGAFRLSVTEQRTKKVLDVQPVQVSYPSSGH